MHFLRVAREALTERRDPNHDRTTRHDALPHAHLAEEIPIDPRIMHGRQGTSTHWPEQCKSSAWGHHAARSEISLSPKKGRAFGHTHASTNVCAQRRADTRTHACTDCGAFA